jgi:hypothetical protein
MLLRLAGTRHCDDRLGFSGFHDNIRLFQGIYACFRECTLVSGFACFTRISDVVYVFCDWDGRDGLMICWLMFCT